MLRWRMADELMREMALTGRPALAGREAAASEKLPGAGGGSRGA